MDYSTIKCIIPDSVYVGVSKLSEIGVIARQNFKKGETIYENTSYLVKLDNLPETIQLQTDQGIFELNKFIHTSHYHEDQFILYNFDSFTNHSCDPTTNCILLNEDDPLPYKCVALKDINEGDELTANYNAFYYEMKDPFICGCGAKGCYGKIAGFKNLTVEQQNEIVDDIDPSFFRIYNLDYLKK